MAFWYRKKKKMLQAKRFMLLLQGMAIPMMPTIRLPFHPKVMVPSVYAGSADHRRTNYGDIDFINAHAPVTENNDEVERLPW